MKAEKINSILGISESYKMPDTLLPILLDDVKRAKELKQYSLAGMFPNDR